MSSLIEPQLAPPGAGLPTPELFIARLMFQYRYRTGDRGSFTALFESERTAIRQLVNSCASDLAGKRVLIERVRGLEDSSRYWSVWMTLEHLRIVHLGIARTIDSLAREIAPTGQASTAAVKPRADVDAAVVEDYEKSCDLLLAAGAAAKLNSTARFAHPWFGPLNDRGWFALAGSHLGLHRRQIERILAGLSSTTK